MTDHDIRLFADDAAIRRVGEGFLACNLTKSEWTHEAHLATTAWLILERPDIAPERDLPGLIRRYNESVGGVNSDSEGYHETITQAYLAAIRAFVAALPAGISDGEACARLLASPMGDKAWPLGFWSRERLFSVAARRGWVEPDLKPLEAPVNAPAGTAG